MTDQELSELLSHPRVRAFVQRIAEEAAERAYSAALPALKKRMLQPVAKPTAKPAKPAAEGDMNYADAARFIGCPANSVRGYVHYGFLEPGKLRATVTVKSCFAFKATYHPRPSRRISGNL